MMCAIGEQCELKAQRMGTGGGFPTDTVSALHSAAAE